MNSVAYAIASQLQTYTASYLEKSACPVLFSNNVDGIIGDYYYHVFSGTSYKYHIPTNTWSTFATYSGYNSRMCAVNNGLLYAFGGWNGGASSSTSTNACDVYNPSTNTWSAISSMSNPRGAGCASDAGGKIYVNGGMPSGSWPFPVNFLEEYNPTTNTWSTKTACPDSLMYHRAIGYNNELYVAGGTNYIPNYTSTYVVSTFRKYTPSTNTWTNLSGMLYARAAFPISLYDNKIYCFGGLAGTYAGGTTVKCEYYDLTNGTWNLLSDSTNSFSYSNGGTYNNKMYSVGNQTFEINPKTKIPNTTLDLLLSILAISK